MESFKINHVSSQCVLSAVLMPFIFCIAVYEENAFWDFCLLQYLQWPLRIIGTLLHCQFV